MKIIDVIKSFNTEELAEFLDNFGTLDYNPWNDWWNENYCEKCMPEISTESYYYGYMECAYCELHGNCKYFQNMKEVPNNKEVIKMWLETEDY